jgi:steroid delta-isomerase-like uncharacterized protein
MSAEQARAIVRRFYEELVNARDPDALNEIIAEDIVMHDPTIPGGVLHGRDAFTQFVGVLVTAFPDLHMTAEDAVVQDDKAATRWSLAGTHLGPLMDIKPSGKTVQLDGMDIFTLADGQIVDMWVALDTLALMQQINALPMAPTG